MVSAVPRSGSAHATAPAVTLARAISEESDAIAVRVIERTSGSLGMRIAEVVEPRTPPKDRPRTFIARVDLGAVNPCADDVLTGVGREDDLSDAAISELKRATACLANEPGAYFSNSGTAFEPVFTDDVIREITIALLWCARAQAGQHISLESSLERLGAQCDRLRLNRHEVEAFLLAGSLGEYSIANCRGHSIKGHPMRLALRQLTSSIVSLDEQKWAARRKPVEDRKSAWLEAIEVEKRAADFHVRAVAGFQGGMIKAEVVNRAMSDWGAAKDAVALTRATYDAAEESFRRRRNAWGKPPTEPTEPEAA